MLDQRFFAEELPRLLAAYRQQRQEENVQPELLLRHGITLRVEGNLTAGPQFLTFEYTLRNNDRRLAVVPYDSIVAVSLAPAERDRPRPGLI